MQQCNRFLLISWLIGLKASTRLRTPLLHQPLLQLGKPTASCLLGLWPLRGQSLRWIVRWCINIGDSPDQLFVFSVLFEVVFKTVAWDVWFLEKETSSEHLVFSFNSLGLLLAPSAIQRVILYERVQHGLSYGAEWFWGLGSSLKRGLMHCIWQSHRFFASNDLHKLWQ